MVYAQSFPQLPAVKDLSFGSDLAVRFYCPACSDPSPHVFEEFDNGCFVCACGLALGDQIVDAGSEWHTPADGEGEAASSNPLTEGMEQLDTAIGSQDGGPRIVNELRLTARLRKEPRLRNPLCASRDISRWCDQFLESETICDIVNQLYRRTYEAKLLRGKPLNAIIAACIFVACRQAHIPRTFREICDIMRVSKKVLGHCYKTLVRAFDLAPGVSTNSSGSPCTAPETLLARYCDLLDLSTRVHSVCTDIIVAARKHGIAVGRSPGSVAAGAIYYTSHLLGDGRKVQDICTVASVSESTIKLVFRLFQAGQAKLVKQEWIDEGRTKLYRRLLSFGNESTNLK